MKITLRAILEWFGDIFPWIIFLAFLIAMLICMAGCDYATHTRSYEITPKRSIKTSGPTTHFRVVTTDTGKTYVIRVKEE